ncbi:hypothetical protein LCGC14_1978320 [marine sediment metagenome]|uniref:YokE-like PH domain-containing protein n=1 Tax=marine sediment metagenome TaxID=412755 RepID=A0A0F9F9Z8_9ZZZZ
MALRGLLGGEDVYLILRSATRVDVGSWLGGSRVCVAAVADGLLLFATARGPLAWLPEKLAVKAEGFVERIPLAALTASSYNHVTGELLLAPVAGGRAGRLKLPPLDAYQLLAQIHHVNRSNREPRHA